MAITIVYFDADADNEEILEVLREDGACVLVDVMDENLKSRVNDELQPFIEATPHGRDDFTGRLTGRTGALVARSEASRELVMHSMITDLARQFLEPYTDKIQVHLTQIINIEPGQGVQPRHRDRLAWGGYLPSDIEPQFNTMWALTDFTEENGATAVVPGSHRYGKFPGTDFEMDRFARYPTELQATGEAGSVLMLDGRTWHSVMPNLSGKRRSCLIMRWIPWWFNMGMNRGGSLERKYWVETIGINVRTEQLLRREVYETLSPDVKALYRHWVEP